MFTYVFAAKIGLVVDADVDNEAVALAASVMFALAITDVVVAFCVPEPTIYDVAYVGTVVNVALKPTSTEGTPGLLNLQTVEEAVIMPARYDHCLTPPTLNELPSKSGPGVAPTVKSLTSVLACGKKYPPKIAITRTATRTIIFLFI